MAYTRANTSYSPGAKAQKDLALLYRYYTGYQSDVISDIWAGSLTESELAEIGEYRVVINLTAPSVNRLVSGVYGGTVSRTIESGSAYQAELESLLSPGRGYGQICRQWFSNAVLFGTSFLCWEIKDGKPAPYLPNPIYTEIKTNPFDCSEVTSLKEYSPCGRYYKEITDTYYAVGTDDEETERTEHGLGVCPVVTIYGEDLTSFGSAWGLSLVRDSIQYSKIVSRLQLNLLQLVKTYTRPQATLTGEPNIVSEDTGDAQRELADAFLPGGILPLREGGKFDFVSPSAEFSQILETIQWYLRTYALSAAIPIDALETSQIDPNQSATAARLRNQPMATALLRLTESMKLAEIRSLQIAAALVQWLDTDSDVTFSDLQDLVKININMEPAGQPESHTEEVTAWIQLYISGAKTIEDLVRHFNGNLSETEIQRRIATAAAKPIDPSLQIVTT